jgi:hypothetical protein
MHRRSRAVLSALFVGAGYGIDGLIGLSFLK